MEVSGRTFLAANAAVVASRQGQWWMKNLAILLVTKSRGRGKSTTEEQYLLCRMLAECEIRKVLATNEPTGDSG